MFDKIARSWSLLKASAGVLRADTELLVFPLVSGIAALLVTASFVAPIFWLSDAQLDRLGQEGFDPITAIWAFAFYLSQYFVIFFFNSALVGAALIRLEGGDPTLADGLRIARSRIGVIFGYALIAATVGLILRAIEQRAGLIGRIVTGLIGVAWTFATFLAVPVLVSQNIGPVDALKQSAQLLRKTWGENLVGSGGIGVVGGLLIALAAVLGIVATVFSFANGWTGLGIGLIVLTVLSVLILGLVQAALSGIYSAALYRYAATGEVAPGFDRGLIGSAFASRG